MPWPTRIGGLCSGFPGKLHLVFVHGAHFVFVSSGHGNLQSSREPFRCVVLAEGVGLAREGELRRNYAHFDWVAFGLPTPGTLFLTDQRLMFRRVERGKFAHEPPMTFEGAEITRVWQTTEHRSGRFALEIMDDGRAVPFYFQPVSGTRTGSMHCQTLFEELKFCVLYWQQGRNPFD